MEFFILGLSFLGWALLGMLPGVLCQILFKLPLGFVGTAFVTPYIASTNAWLYRTLKAKCPELQEQPEILEEPVIPAETL